MNVQPLLISAIEIPETRVTSYFDQEVYEEFKKTIVHLGVLEPVVVVESDGRYYLVDGLHRLQEAKGRGDELISSVVIPGDEKDVFLTNLFLNVMRGKTKVGEMRQVIQTLVGGYQLDTLEIGRRTGLSKGYIDDLVSIGDLPEDILAAFDEGTLSKGAALALTRLSGADLQLRVFAQVSGRKVTVDDIEGIVELLREERREVAPPPPRTPPPPVKEMACDLCHQAYPLKFLRSVLVCADCQVEHADLLGEQKTDVKENT